MICREGLGLSAGWLKLPFAAGNEAEFARGLDGWLGEVFYETLPRHGYEVREEQIYTTFRMARALVKGETLFAEAGAGTGKTFAYLLPAVCYARFRGKPVVVASASGVLQAQLVNPEGDIQALSRVLGLNIDARPAIEPTAYACNVKVQHLDTDRADREGRGLYDWALATGTGARTEVPAVSDALWGQVAWDASLPCDTCEQRGICHVVAARRNYRIATDLVVTNHDLFAQDLLTRAERLEARQLPLLPAYSAVVLDEGHLLPDTWQRAQGRHIKAAQLRETLRSLTTFAHSQGSNQAVAEARGASRLSLASILVPRANQASQRFLAHFAALPAIGGQRQELPRLAAASEDAALLAGALGALQNELATEEAMLEGTDEAAALAPHQARLEDAIRTLRLFQSAATVAWLEGDELWIVPREPVPLHGPDRLPARTPLLFSSATLEPAYAARVLHLSRYDQTRVGVPFNLAAQVVVYQTPAAATAAAEVERVAAVIRATQGRALVLLRSMADVRRYKAGLKLPWQVLFEGEGDRGAMLRAFKQDVSSVLVGATFWEGVDVPGEALSCVVIPQLPFPAADPLIRERRSQAEANGEDPTLAVDVPEMLLKLKQGMGRLIRTEQDRGVIALLAVPDPAAPWAAAVAAALPEDAERTDVLARVAVFSTARV